MIIFTQIIKLARARHTSHRRLGFEEDRRSNKWSSCDQDLYVINMGFKLQLARAHLRGSSDIFNKLSRFVGKIEGSSDISGDLPIILKN